MSSTNTRTPLLGIYGAGGFAREVAPMVRANLDAFARAAAVSPDLEICFIETQPAQAAVHGMAVMSEDAFLSEDRPLLFNVAVADAKGRQALAERCEERGARPVELRAASVIEYDRNRIGPGAILCDQVIITSDAIIGRYFHANLQSYVAHDCVIGDFVTFAPAVRCNGNVHVEDFAYIGTGAIIKNGTRDNPTVIGRGAVIGAGAVVTKNVAPFTTVVGNPARPLERRN